MAPAPLQDFDAAERDQLLKIVVFFSGLCFIILTALWVFLGMDGTLQATTVAVGWLSTIPPPA